MATAATTAAAETPPSARSPTWCARCSRTRRSRTAPTSAARETIVERRRRGRPLPHAARAGAARSRRRRRRAVRRARRRQALEVLRGMSSTEFFEGVRSRVITSLYDDREVWALLGYEGPSYDQGGYLNRGFDDLDWLPDRADRGGVLHGRHQRRARRRRSTLPIDSPSFGHDDDDVVVVIGSGAGGGTLANELCQQGVHVVRARGRPAPDRRGLRQRRVARVQPDGVARPRAPRPARWRIAKDFPNLPAWTVKAVGGTTTHWAGALPALQGRTSSGPAVRVRRRIDGANLLDWPIALDRPRAVLRPGRGQDGRHPRARPPAAAGQQQLQGVRERRRARRLHGVRDRPVRRRTPSPTTAGPAIDPGRLQLPGRQARRQVVDAGRRAARRPGRPASSTCGPSCQAVQITHDGARPADGVLYLDGDGNAAAAAGAGRRASPATRSRRRGCCCSRPRRCFPDGLANSSGQVGRNYMRHLTGSVYARVRQARAHVPRRDDGRDRHRRVAATTPTAASSAATTCETLSLGVAVPGRLRRARAPGARSSPRSWTPTRNIAGLWIVGEDMPQETNRVTLNARGDRPARAAGAERALRRPPERRRDARARVGRRARRSTRPSARPARTARRRTRRPTTWARRG